MKKKLHFLILLFICSITTWGQNAVQKYEYYGVLNPGGGQTDKNTGIEVTVSGSGNLQVHYNGSYQIYHPSKYIPTRPYYSPSGSAASVNGIVVGFRDTSSKKIYTMKGGELYVDGQGATYFAPKSFEVKTDPNDPTGKTQLFIGNYDLNLNGRIYPLKLEFTYIHPQPRVYIKYTLTIPEGNPSTQNVVLSHGLDTFLLGNDAGPGYAIDNPSVLTAGVRRSQGNFEAFVYQSGVRWSGYYSAHQYEMPKSLAKTPSLSFDKTIDPSETTDNGIGLSINFGNKPGTYTSSSFLTFKCNAPEVKPIYPITNYTLPCKGGKVDIAYKGNIDFVDDNGDGVNDIEIRYEDNIGHFITPVNGKVEVGAGTYKVYFYDTLNSCMSAVETITVKDGVGPCPSLCIKPAVTSGTALETQVGVSTIGKIADWPQNRKGAFIALQSQSKGFVVSRLTTIQVNAMAKPQEGMMVYDTDIDCFKIYSKDRGVSTLSWKCFNVQSCPDN